MVAAGSYAFEQAMEEALDLAGGATWAVPARSAAFTALNKLLHGLALAWHATNILGQVRATILCVFVHE